MKYQERALRITAALALAGLIASQIPMRGQTALGSVRPPGSVITADGYLDGNSDNSGSFLGINGLTNRNAITGIALGLVGFGAYSTVLDSRALATAGAGAAAGGGAALENALVRGTDNKPIYDVLKSNLKDFSEAVRLVEDAELINILRNEGPFTFFAPTNSGFLIDSNSLIRLHSPENKTVLVALIKRHTIKERYKISDLLALPDGAVLETLSGDKLIVTHSNGLRLNNVLVGQNDIAASNGWIHPIDSTLNDE
jgi:uncharacterized surface protein with fasciclin (FAS1) repeats